MKVKWKILLAGGFVLLSLTIISMRAYPRQAVWTGEYLDIYEGSSYVKEYETIPAETNPYWVKAFQNNDVGAFIGSFILIGLAATKLWWG